MIALAGKDTDKLYFLVAYVPVVGFWGLDAYYLIQEKLYRSLYDKVRQTDEDNIDFSLKATTEEFGGNKLAIAGVFYLQQNYGFTYHWHWFAQELL